MTRQTLPESIEIAKFWKTRRRDIAVTVTLSSYQDINIVNVREYVTGSDGCMRPSTKGIAMAVKRLPELHQAVGKALTKARELRLIDDNGSDA
jgi:hypothetical protein